MSRRCGYPKPKSSERTKYRWRMRHEIPTVNDEVRRTRFEQQVDKMKKLMGMLPEEEKVIIN